MTGAEDRSVTRTVLPVEIMPQYVYAAWGAPAWNALA